MSQNVSHAPNRRTHFAGAGSRRRKPGNIASLQFVGDLLNDVVGKTVFGQDCDGVVIRDNGVPVSAVLNFYHKDTVLPYYGGGTVGARRNGANDFLYWEVMRRAVLRGYRRFDFGRSKAGTGAFAFKKNWGFEPQWLEYEYHFLPGQTMPDKNPLNPKYALFIAAWKKLPLPVANFIGPWLIRGLG